MGFKKIDFKNKGEERRKDKAEASRQIARDIEEFLAKGKEITQVDTHASRNEPFRVVS